MGLSCHENAEKHTFCVMTAEFNFIYVLIGKFIHLTEFREPSQNGRFNISTDNKYEGKIGNIVEQKAKHQKKFD